ncbi:uncharacterized protein LOC135681234 isoform X1 [Rhopilema esculentum]|uniref:uncharacterized protein LOC135681234 isoform X1 n=2 Tax=Rhopilema esculentum TaxID=499914 RepID=UPI0031D09321
MKFYNTVSVFSSKNTFTIYASGSRSMKFPAGHSRKHFVAMVPPSNQKHLIQVEKSKTKTIKFKNGFPPKVIRSRSSFGEILKPNHSIDLIECQPSLKSLDNKIPQRYGKGQTQKDEHKVSSVQPLTSASRGNFIPSNIKQYDKARQERPVKAPFSPPPTMSELRSLTKKIGRFYTLSNGSSSAPPLTSSRSPRHQKAILDIERALSQKDVSGLEKCYKRIFQGNAEPIRTIVRNQTFPNQRSRQASCPVEMLSSANNPHSPRYLPKAASKTTTSSMSRLRSLSTDSGSERLPIVPAPYFRSECSSSSRKFQQRKLVEGPVMFSSPKHDYMKRSNALHTAPAVLTLDPEQFPEQPPRTPQLDSLNNSANGTNCRPNQSPKSKRPMVYKSSSQWNQRAPNSTPEPRLGNEMQIISAKHKDLLPQVIPAQLRHNPEQVSQASRRAELKLSKNRFDTSEANAEPQSSEARTDRREITDDVLTERNRVLTSGGDSDTECDYNDPSQGESESHKRADKSELTSVGEKVASSDKICQETVNPPSKIEHSDAGAVALDENITASADHNTQSSMVDSIDLQALDLNSISSSVSDTDENRIAEIRSGLPLNSSATSFHRHHTYTDSTRESEMNELKSSSFENVTVVVVNVTTDEGEDVNADIYEYNRKREAKDGNFDPGIEPADEANKENGQQAARNRKEELEALLKEHSTIVEQVKNLSESCSHEC